MSGQDKSIWEHFIQSVNPLRHREDVMVKTVPPRLRVRPAPERTLLSELDLHGYTLDEAHQCFKLFLATHLQAGSQKISVITGKGIGKTGKIKNEIVLWIETPYFRDNIQETQWKNDGGVLEITLKRKKKNGKGKNCPRD